jgi:hypothetical protein
MTATSNVRRMRTTTIAFTTAVLAFAIVHAQEDTTRAIVPEKFLKARPAAPAAKTPQRPASYRPVDRVRPESAKATGDTVELGVTIWRLRAAKAGEPARLLVQEADAGAKEFTPERIGVGTSLRIGDRVRLSIESPRAGYLYVIDREQYADGTVGPPYLVFPTTRTRGGDNKVTGGRLIDIPAQDDRPPYFTMKPSRPDQTGERLTLVVTEKPLPEVKIGADPIELPAAQVADWEARGAGTVQRLEMIGGAGRAWSRAEQRAAADATRLLTQEDPPPQTLFRILVKQPDLVVVNVTLPQLRGAPTK